MIVTRAYDGSFIITGIPYAVLEDLVSAYDSSPISFFSFSPPDDLYDEQDQIEPLRKALADAQPSHS